METIIENWLFDPVIGKVVTAFFAVIIVVILVRFSHSALGKYVEDNSKRYRIRKLLTFVGYILALFLISIVYSDKLSGITVFLGVAGAGIAFALQEVIVSIAGWVALAFGRLYNIGDRIQLGGIKGDVIDIGILRTTLMECGGWIKGDLYNGRIVRVSNSFIFKDPVYNYSSDFPFLWDEIILTFDAQNEHQAIKEKLQSILELVTGEYANTLKSNWRHMTEKFMLENAKLDPFVSLSINDNGIEFSLRYVVDYKKRRVTRDAICVKVLDYINNNKHSVQLACPALTLNSSSPLKVNLSKTQ